MKKRPHLVELNPKLLKAKDEPGILFRGRLKGYFLAPKLCRMWVLATYDAAIARGEPFVKWVDPEDPSSTHDGTIVFAHFFTIHYINLHQPGMSVHFDSRGALKQSTIHFQRLQNYIWAYRSKLARRCHDMLKQQYATKAHCKKAWKPLTDWLFRNQDISESRVLRVTSFGKEDDDLHTVVGKCLWRVANATNHPWGVAAVKPRGYSAVAPYKKVVILE